MLYTESELWEIVTRVGWVVTATDDEPLDGMTTYSCSLHDDTTNYVGDFVGNLESGYTFELMRKV